MSDVLIKERIGPGKVIITDARFLTPEQLREEHAHARHARHAERLRRAAMARCQRAFEVTE